MKQQKHTLVILAITLLLFFSPLSNAATLYLDLDINTPGIQDSLTLSPGSDYEVGIVFSGDGSTQFDSFAFDLVYTSSVVGVHTPVAGAVVDSAPLMAFDIYGAVPVSSGDPLAQGSMPIPLGFVGGLGGVGASSVGGMPFPLIGEDESVGLFSVSLNALEVGASNLALTGYPFGIGAGLSLAGESVPVTLKGATVTVVPVPPALLLFASGMLALFGIGRRENKSGITLKKMTPQLSLIAALVVVSPHGLATPLDSNADINGDAMVTSLDISMLASCFGKDPLNNKSCAKADVDRDGDIDADDFSFVSTRLGQSFPETLFEELVLPSSFAVGDRPESKAIADLNGDGVSDVVTVNSASDDISVLLGNGDGSFQAQQRYTVADGANSIILEDINGDGVLDVVTARLRGDDISVLLGNGDGSFQAKPSVSGSFRYLIDLNGDSVLDIVSTGDEEILLSLGNGDGSFQVPLHIDIGMKFGSIDLADLNRDGVLDMVVLIDNHVEVFIGNGDGSFQTQQQIAFDDRIHQVTLDDINGDDVIDIAVAHGDGHVSGWFGNGDGSFQTQQLLTDRSLSILDVYEFSLDDVNGDGVVDLVTFNSESPISVWLGNGDGTFQWTDTIAFSGNDISYSHTLTDLNNDDVLDMVVHLADYHVKDLSGAIWVLIGDVDGTYQAPQILAPGGYSPNIADVNRDGVPDIVAISAAGEGVSILLGTGDGGFQTEQRFAAGKYISSISLSDVDDDGVLDVVTTNRGSDDISVILGNGDGSFQAPQHRIAGDFPCCTALDDLNGDGVLDLVTANSNSDDISVMLGNGDGTFQAQQRFDTGFWPASLVLSDLNSDGFLDVVTTSDDTDTVSVLLGNGDGTLQAKQGYILGYNNYDGLSTAIGDVNEDGVLDIVTWAFNNEVIVLLGNGDGSFQAQQPINIHSNYYNYNETSIIDLGDLNGDSLLDIVVNSGPESLVLIGDGNGGFQLSQHPNIDSGFRALGDLNGDNVLDVVGIRDQEIVISLGNGDGSFQEQHNIAVGRGLKMITIEDLNNDGVMDLVVSLSWHAVRRYQHILLLLGNGDGTFHAPYSLNTGATPHSIAFGHLNKDGAIDLVGSNKGSIFMLLGE
jgi:hypothetical protein